MYLLSLRLAPSPWVVTMVSGTAQYTVPSVSTQTVTPRRVGFFDCSSAPRRAEPAGPSVWCTMMLRQGWALATSPHGASQTILRPGISGVPDARAIVASSVSSAAAGWAASAAARKQKATSRPGATRAWHGLRISGCNLGRPGRIGLERRSRIVDRAIVLAVLLGSVKRTVGVGHQPVGELADAAIPLR